MRASQNIVHLQNIPPADRSINRLPFISLGDSPIAVAVPPPVQLRNALLHALDKSVDRTHAVFRVLGTAFERGQGDDAVIYDDSDLLGRGKGGVSAGQHCLWERGGNNYKWTFVGNRPTGNLRWN